MEIRDATARDGAECAAIYEPYVCDTAITFATRPAHGRGDVGPDRAEPARPRVAGGAGGLAGGRLRLRRPVQGDGPPRAWACEVSVYLQPGLRRTGLGRMLYEELFARLAARGYLTAVAGTTLPNPASEGLHRAMGFEPVGVYRKIGFSTAPGTTCCGASASWPRATARPSRCASPARRPPRPRRPCVLYRWKPTRARPSRTAAVMPAAASRRRRRRCPAPRSPTPRAARPGARTGRRPGLRRGRARRSSLICSRYSSAGAAPVQDSHAGEEVEAARAGRQPHLRPVHGLPRELARVPARAGRNQLRPRAPRAPS